MKRQRAPYIFLLLLVLILVFVGGLRYGQSVERTNKVVDFLLSITPSPTKTPEVTTPVTFDTFVNASCGFSVLHPASSKFVENASESGKLDKVPEVLFDCSKKPLVLKETKSVGTSAATIQYKGQTFKAIHYKTNPGLTVFTIQNPVNAKSIMFAVSDTLLPLFTSTLQFTK